MFITHTYFSFSNKYLNREHKKKLIMIVCTKLHCNLFCSIVKCLAFIFIFTFNFKSNSIIYLLETKRHAKIFTIVLKTNTLVLFNNKKKANKKRQKNRQTKKKIQCNSKIKLVFMCQLKITFRRHLPVFTDHVFHVTNRT